jgi:autotransporter-associated beta strand protein
VVALLGGTLTNVSGANAYTVGVNTAAGDFDLSADIGTSTRALVKQGANALTLSGDNTFDKLITVSEGTLKAGSATAFNNTGTLAALPGTTFDLNGFDARFISMTSNTGTITTTGAGSGIDTLTLSASNVDGIANLFTDNGSRQLKLDFTSAASPAAARQATTNVNNTFSGGLILGNVMRVSVPAGTVGTPGAITSGALGRGAITLNGGATINTNGAQIWFSAANRTLVNHVIVNSNAGNGSRAGSFRLNVTGCVVSGNIDANGTDAWFGSDGTTTLLLSGQLTGLKGFRFFNSNGTNPYTATLNNATANPNDYAGNTIVDNSSITLTLGAANQIPNGPGKGNVVINFGRLDLAGFAETINGLSGGTATTIDNLTAANSTNILTFGEGDASGNTFSGIIANTTGELALVKTGNGTQTLAGANSYSGTTTVDGGTLLIHGDQLNATGAVQVNAATLGGTGRIGGAVTVASPGKLAPGTDGTIQSLDIAATTTINGTYACDVDGATTDELFVVGDLVLTGSTLAINEINPGTSGTYVIATYTGSRTGTLGGTLPDRYSVTYDDANKEVELVITAPGGFSQWVIDNNVTGGETGDDDKDGIINLVEYALGLDPQIGDPAPGTFVGNLLTFTKGSEAKTAGDVTYTIQTSTTLEAGSWSDVAATQNPDTISYQLPENVPGGRIFARLRVTRP